jgi:hypothetical protein
MDNTDKAGIRRRKKLSGKLRDAVQFRIMQAAQKLPDGADARSVEEKFEELWPTEFVEWKTVTVSEQARHREIRRVVGEVRAADSIPQSVKINHARELAERVLSRPELFLPGATASDSGEAALVAYARDHLRAYEEASNAESVLVSRQETLSNLEGAPTPFIRAISGDVLIRGEAGALLLEKVRRETRRLYPNLPEQPDTGALLPECTFPKEIAREVWMEVGSYEGVGGHLGFDVGIEPFDGRWRVCRPNLTAYAVVGSQVTGRTEELRTALQALGSDPELRAIYRRVLGARDEVHLARDGLLSIVRKIGDRVRHGVELRGSCELGY